MPRYAQLVIGPAGSGKSTYCHNIQQHCATIKRTVHIVNLDPAAEEFKYEVSHDVRDLVSLEDVMEEVGLGPNGGLVYCMEYLEDNLSDWLGEELQDYGDDDYIIFDCPGQIELYSHVPVFRSIVEQLKGWDFRVCAVYLLDSQFVEDASKYIAGSLAALSAMVQLELPHVNVLTKVDLLPNKRALDKYLMPDGDQLAGELNENMGPRHRRLNEAMAGLVDDYCMVSFVALDGTDEESLEEVMAMVDNAIQYGEDADVKIAPDDDQAGDEDNYADLR